MEEEEEGSELWGSVASIVILYLKVLSKEIKIWKIGRPTTCIQPNVCKDLLRPALLSSRESPA